MRNGNGKDVRLLASRGRLRDICHALRWARQIGMDSSATMRMAVPQSGHETRHLPTMRIYIRISAFLLIRETW